MSKFVLCQILLGQTLSHTDNTSPKAGAYSFFIDLVAGLKGGKKEIKTKRKRRNKRGRKIRKKTEKRDGGEGQRKTEKRGKGGGIVRQ